MSATAAISVNRINGLLGVSSSTARVAAVIASYPLGIASVDVAERQPHVLKDLIEQPERPSVHVFGADDVIAGAKQLHDRVETAHATSEGESVKAVLQRGDISLERFASRILSPGVFVAFVLPQTVLDVRGREVDRGHDSAGQRLWTLACVDRSGTETRGQVLVKNARHADTLRLGVVRKITAHLERRN